MPDHTAGVELGPGRNGGGAASDRDGARSGSTRPAARKIVAGGSRWKLRNWRLRTKLIAVLTVPLLTAFVLGGLRAAGDLDRANAFDESARDVSSALDVVALVHELQNERNLMVAYVAAGRPAEGSAAQAVQGQIQRSNAGMTRLSQQAGSVSSDDEDKDIIEQIAGRLRSVQAIRDAALNSKFPDVAVYSAYTAMVDAVLGNAAQWTAKQGDPEIGRLATAGINVVKGKEFVGRQNAILMIAATRNSMPVGLTDQARSAQAAFAAAVASFKANAEPSEAQFFSDTYSGAEVDHLESIKQLTFSRAATNQPLDINMDALREDARATSEALHKVERSLFEKLRSRAGAAADEAKQDAWRDAAILLAIILIAMGITVIVARSLLVPLRVLRRDALDVANRRLPETVQRILADPDPVEAAKNAVEPVPVFTREETGQLARSFDAVHDQAVRMATEQALLRDNINSIFVNLSRRSQALVERQLSLIDRLEQDEQDPDQLASLFELDHLATRMRRNSESLLVLSGSGLSRQLSRPVPASEVVGAAVSEVEQYARIEVLSAPDIAVQGRAVSDLVHLIAELLDNATSFSEPEKKVYVRMAVTRKKELAIQITDSGVGMTEDEIEAANARLADPPDLDVAVTRRMGLYVVARLAKRHSIIVRLRDNEDIEGGLISRITVPAVLVHGSGAPAQTNNLVSPVTSTTPPFGDTAAKASGIAGAFTGSMPRLRADGLAESPVERTGEQLIGYPNFQAGFGSGHTGGLPAVDDTGGWGPPASPEEINSALNGHAIEDLSSYGLFGEPMPEQEYDEYANGYTYNGTSYSETSYDAPPITPAETSSGGDYPTERLPIYEAVLSQWFEAGDTGTNQRATGKPDTNGSINGSINDTPRDYDDESDADLLDPQPDTEDVAADLAVPTPEPEPVADPWISPGDAGWERAKALLERTADSMTTAGLPKRVPKAHLVPGSATPQAATTGTQPAVPALPPRTADAIRGRMSSFQQGVRRGRHALIDAYAGDQTGSDESRQDEEQE